LNLLKKPAEGDAQGQLDDLRSLKWRRRREQSVGEAVRPFTRSDWAFDDELAPPVEFRLVPLIAEQGCCGKMLQRSYDVSGIFL
jgi:hypothetical protein